MNGKPTVSERIENLEIAVLGLADSFKEQDKRLVNVLTSMAAQLKSAIEDTLLIVQAGFQVISSITGKDIPGMVDKVVKDLKYEKMVKVFESNKARFMTEVESGKFKKVDVISKDSIVVGTSHLSDGSPYGAGVFLSSIKELGKELQDFFIGKPSGTPYVTKNGAIIQLEEIYEENINETN